MTELEAAALLNVRPDHVARLVADGELPAGLGEGAVRAYRDRRKRERRAALDEMAAEAQAEGAYPELAGATCELIDAHHPDCECGTCRAGRDALCGGPAVGTARMGGQSWRVCARCAARADRDPEAEGVVTYDAVAGVAEAAGTPTHLHASPRAVSLFNSVMRGLAIGMDSSQAVLPGDAWTQTEALIARIRDLSKAEPPAGVVLCHGRRAPWRRSARQRSRDRRRRRGW